MPRMTSSTEKHANQSTQVPLVVACSWALASDLLSLLQGEQVISCECMDALSMCAAVTGALEDRCSYTFFTGKQEAPTEVVRTLK